MNEQIDFLAIGDLVTDAFIKIKDAKVTCDIDEHNCKLSLRFGDKVPYEFVDVVTAVGNSPNAAVSATRLGLRTALITNIGDDHNGGECLATLKQNGVSTEFVQIHKSHVISLKQIEATDSFSVFINNKELPIGATFKDAFFERIDQNKI